MRARFPSRPALFPGLQLVPCLECMDCRVCETVSVARSGQGGAPARLPGCSFLPGSNVNPWLLPAIDGHHQWPGSMEAAWLFLPPAAPASAPASCVTAKKRTRVPLLLLQLASENHRLCCSFSWPVVSSSSCAYTIPPHPAPRPTDPSYQVHARQLNGSIRVFPYPQRTGATKQLQVRRRHGYSD